ncbi:hypothetical protein Afil01_61990 [Actinorhabdospora filicis]|uniref:Uncharacterized protein n=1 Tax=Actinorhabdospora filicis TaxID=1785913 RepID=A0A9W6ST75_9ACTN|nr:hypothetical protein [Actinorhabdospora filicis]GLZ81392.1 hypothetical protein Afil01_61990 [Actinorhabdospora filicis]
MADDDVFFIVYYYFGPTWDNESGWRPVWAPNGTYALALKIARRIATEGRQAQVHAYRNGEMYTLDRPVYQAG